MKLSKIKKIELNMAKITIKVYNDNRHYTIYCVLVVKYVVVNLITLRDKLKFVETYCINLSSKELCYD